MAKKLLWIILTLAIASPLQANLHIPQWLKEAKGDLVKQFRLTKDEEVGLFYCSVRDKIVGVNFLGHKRGLLSADIIFANTAPQSFLINEMTQEIVNKIVEIYTELQTQPSLLKTYKVFCVQSANRADWQEMYDRVGNLQLEPRVPHKLLSIEPEN